MKVVVGGIDEARCRLWADQSDLPGQARTWMDFDRFFDFLEQQQWDPATTRATWLFQSPMAVAMDAVEAGNEDVESRLERWWTENHAVLNFHRKHRGRLRLVDFGNTVETLVVDGGDTPAGRTADGAGAQARGADARCSTAQLLYYLFERTAPRYIELYDALRASSSLPTGEVPRFCELDELAVTGALSGMLEAALSGERAQSRLVAFEQLVGERDAELADANNAAVDTLQENELLFLQLHQSQEELRQYSQDNEKLSAAMATRGDELRHLAEEKRRLSERVEHCVTAQQQTARHADALDARVEHLQWQLGNHRKQLALRLDAIRRQNAGGFVRRGARRLLRAMGKHTEYDEMRSQIHELRDSRWFDADWYRQANDDVRLSGADPVQHYYDVGWLEGRNPCAAFDTRYYLDTYADVADSGLNPLCHFIRHGEAEGRVCRAP